MKHATKINQEESKYLYVRSATNGKFNTNVPTNKKKLDDTGSPMKNGTYLTAKEAAKHAYGIIIDAYKKDLKEKHQTDKDGFFLRTLKKSTGPIKPPTKYLYVNQTQSGFQVYIRLSYAKKKEENRQYYTKDTLIEAARFFLANITEDTKKTLINKYNVDSNGFILREERSRQKKITRSTQKPIMFSATLANKQDNKKGCVVEQNTSHVNQCSDLHDLQHLPSLSNNSSRKRPYSSGGAVTEVDSLVLAPPKKKIKRSNTDNLSSDFDFKNGINFFLPPQIDKPLFPNENNNNATAQHANYTNDNSTCSTFGVELFQINRADDCSCVINDPSSFDLYDLNLSDDEAIDEYCYNKEIEENLFLCEKDNHNVI